MMHARFIVIGDGPSDEVLMHVTRWLLADHGLPEVDGGWADLSRTSPKPAGLEERIRRALDLYPSDLLVVHRDAEKKEALDERISEVRAAIDSVTSSTPCIACVPVRMTEAWLLHDEPAIREAAGNPNGRAQLGLPRIKELESVPAKQILQKALEAASELSGARRIRRFRRSFGAQRRRLAERIESFAPLRALPAFTAFERDLAGFVRGRRS
jgi:hypothetical protein